MDCSIESPGLESREYLTFLLRANMTTASNSDARLLLETGGASRAVAILALPFTIGRGAECHLSLPHPQISREHASIERDAGGYRIRDTGSRHGTFVNGTRISDARLRSGDSIALGANGAALLFEAEDDTSTRSLITRLSRDTGPARATDLETLSLFLKAAESLNSVGGIRDVLHSMLEYTLRLTETERGFVFLGDSAETLRLECGQDRAGCAIEQLPPISSSLVRDAAASQLAYILSDTTDEIARGRDSLIANAIRSVVAMPLRSESSNRLLGVLYLDSRTGHHSFSRTRKDILNAIARQATTLLENLRLLEMEREASLLRKELEIAAAIQRQIIPQELPEFPCARLSARSIPCAGVGGDFYDVIPLADGFLAVVADVCGKGIPAALLASMVQGMLHGQVSLAAGCGSLAEMVQALNSLVYSRTPPEKYVTLAVLRYRSLDSSGGQVELVNGGHVAPVIIRSDSGIEIMRDGDLPVGLLEASRFHSISLTLAPGDRVVLVSDGITEAENEDGVQFGIAQLGQILTQPDPIAAVFGAVQDFSHGIHPQDDQTVLAIECLP